MWDIPKAIEVAMPVVDRLLAFIPNPQEREKQRAAAELELFRSMAQVDLAQLDVNKAEAQHPSVFVAGARPATIWLCNGILAYAYIVCPMLTWIAGFFGGKPFPTIDTDAMWVILSALLGVAGMRSFDKKNGVQTDAVEIRRATKA